MSTASAQTGGPESGLPEGVFLAPLGRRIVAYLIDAGAPYVFVLGGTVNLATGGPGWLSVILYLLPIVWGLLVWAMYALAAAGPGMRLMGLQLVGLSDGRPLGWGRALIRGLILSLLSSTVVILIVAFVLMLSQPRRQGWQDLAVDSVVIEERPVAPPRPGEARSIGEWFRNLFSGGKKSEPAAITTGHEPVDPAEAADEAKPIEQPEPVEAPTREPAGPRSTLLVEEPESAAQQEDPSSESPADETSIAPAVAAAPPAEEEPAVPPPSEGWIAVLDDEREIAITGLVLFGRNPQARPGEEPQVIKVVDSERTVSKTHLAVTVDSRGVLVADRGSTNGSAITDPYGSYELLTAETAVRIPGEGYTVSFGKHHLRIARRVD